MLHYFVAIVRFLEKESNHGPATNGPKRPRATTPAAAIRCGHPKTGAAKHWQQGLGRQSRRHQSGSPLKPNPPAIAGQSQGGASISLAPPHTSHVRPVFSSIVLYRNPLRWVFTFPVALAKRSLREAAAFRLISHHQYPGRRKNRATGAIRLSTGAW